MGAVVMASVAGLFLVVVFDADMEEPVVKEV